MDQKNTQTIRTSPTPNESRRSNAVEKKSSGSWLDTAALIIFVLTVFLVPVLFIPDPVFPLFSTKTLLIVVGGVGSLGLWLIARLKDGQMMLPNATIIFLALLVPIVYFLSSLFSGSALSSLVGTGFEVDTTVTTFLLFAIFLLTTILLRTRRMVVYIYTAFLIAAFAVAVFQGARLFIGADLLSFQVLQSAVSNLIGTWSDFGVFFGVVAIVSLLTTQLLDVKRPLQIFSYILLLFSLFFLVLVNFYVTWYFLAALSLLCIVHIFMRGTGGARVSLRNSISTIFVLIVSVVFIISGGPMSDALSDTFGIRQLSVRPSWSSTLEITTATLQDTPLLGVGPNQFVNQWLLHKPEGVNNSVFWNTDFDAGTGLLSSVVVITGLAGAMAWLIFFVFYLYYGAVGISDSLSKNSMSRYLRTSSFFASLYLWIAVFVYVPSIVILFFAFLFSGIYIAVLHQEGILEGLSYSSQRNPRAGFISILAIAVLLIVVGTGGYMYSQKYISNMYYQKGVAAVNEDSNIAAAEENIRHAISVDEQDRYYRALAQITMSKLNEVASQQDEEDRNQELQSLLNEAVQYARRATEIDPQNYLNWIVLGGVYEALVPKDIPNSYERADEAYREAMEVNPHNPALYLTRARLELIAENIDAAEEYARQALNLKQNYTEGVFLLAQIQTRKGDLDSAIKSVRTASQMSSNDPTVFFQLGLLYYENKEYRNAISALSRAIEMSPEYANARYYRGLSRYETGQVSGAIEDFIAIQKTNPDNKEVQQVLESLRAGREPFTNAVDASDIEEREGLPVGEE